MGRAAQTEGEAIQGGEGQGQRQGQRPGEGQREGTQPKVRTFRFHPLPWQSEARGLWEHYSRLVVTGGIFTGKSEWGSFSLLDLIKRLGRGLYWWVAGLNWHMDGMWDKFSLACRSIGARVVEKPYRQVWLSKGRKFEAVTAKNIGLLRTKHPRVVIVDELGTMTHAQVEKIEARTVGAERVLWMGSAEYQPDLIRFMRYGRDHHEDRWALRQVSTPEAGIVSTEELKHLEKELPRRVWNRDILGIIPEGEGAIFTKLDRLNWWGDGQPVKALLPKTKERYVVGYDQAKTTDFSVIAVRKISTRQIVHMSRFQRMDYHAQWEIVFEISEAYNLAPIFGDATGALGVFEIGERLRLKRKKRPYLEPVTFNNAMKQDMVDKITVEVEQEHLKVPGPEYGEPYQVFLDEMRVYEMRRSQKGLVWTYGAPEGMHDDTVTAVGLTCLAAADDDGGGPIKGLEDDENDSGAEREEQEGSPFDEHAVVM